MNTRQSTVSLFSVLLSLSCHQHFHHRTCDRHHYHCCHSLRSLVSLLSMSRSISIDISIYVAHSKLCYKWLCYEAPIAVLQSTYIPDRPTSGGATKHMCYKTQMAVLQNTCTTKHKWLCYKAHVLHMSTLQKLVSLF